MRDSTPILKLIPLAAAALALAGCARAPAPLNRLAVAYTAISNAEGVEVAAAELWQDIDNVVHVDIQFHSLPIGSHGIHFHAVGRCEAAGTAPFTSAGAHFNPLGRQHGLDNSAGPHAGDAPSFTVDVGGRGRATFTTDRVSLTVGSTTLFDGDGSAIVVHAAADDQISQPAGNSGPRIACGVLRR